MRKTPARLPGQSRLALLPVLSGLILSACAGTRAVRFAEPRGALVRIGQAGEARRIPFEERLDAEEAHRLEVAFPEEVLSRIGFTSLDLERARAKRSHRLLGALVCPFSGDSPSVFRLDVEEARIGLLEGGVVYCRDERPDEGLVLLFKATAVGIGLEDPEIDVHVGRTRGRVATAAKVGGIAGVLIAAGTIALFAVAAALVVFVVG
ncbi:MAG: hypothetical protein ACREIU_06905 [Planctomycetota bacterium]